MKKIFIADDNQNLLSYLEKSLREAGHEVVTESTGLSAINRLMEYTPDIICLDYFLPNLNGDKLCQIIRKMDHLKNAYLVVMSAAAKELQIDPHNIGANALIAKETFKATANHIFSAIEDAREPSGDKQRSGIMGGSSVQSRQMTLELLEKNRHLLTILDSISEGIVEIYRGQIVYANPAAVAILGKQREPLLTAHFS
jgi:two-component system cell cycle sensor histidine kinase/response regulator CckA